MGNDHIQMIPNQQIVAITATFTAEPLATSLTFWVETLGIDATLEFTPYRQVMQQLIDSNSLFSKNQAGMNVILMRISDWQEAAERNSIESLDFNHIKKSMQLWIDALKQATTLSTLPHLICFCPDNPVEPLLTQVETAIVTELSHYPHLYFLTTAEINHYYPVPHYHDHYSEQLGDIPFTPFFFTALGTHIMRKWYALHHLPYKVIVLDADETLWQGVCGEEGVFGIQIDEHYQFLQEFMIKQHHAGMLLTLCSKNQEEDVIAVFEQRPEMRLKRQHLVSWRINWQPKSDNIKSLAEELQLGLDSFIFIDDNPLECAEVQAHCPQVFVLQLPESKNNIKSFLNHIWIFDHLRTTAADQQRTQFYQDELQRHHLQQASLTLAHFLANLQLKVNISPIQSPDIPRIAQLTQRTNQFNLTTIRRTEGEIGTLLYHHELEGIAITVRDRFGDYGLVGALLFRVEQHSIIVDTFLLSCRALERGVEYQMLAELGKIAITRQLSHVLVTYLATPKNQPALNFLLQVGSDFKQSVENKIIFNFPAEQIATVVYQPDTEVPVLPKTISDPSPLLPRERGEILETQEVTVGSIVQPALIQKIATELNTVEAIFNQIYLKNQKNRPTMAVDCVAPTTPFEKKLVQLWQTVLGVTTVGIHDHFFTLGGHSLAAVQLIARIQEQWNIHLSIQQLFNTPTIADLALVILEQKLMRLTPHKLSQLMTQVTQLSEEEVQQQVNAHIGFLDKNGFTTEDIDKKPSYQSSFIAKMERYCAVPTENFAVGENTVLVYAKTDQTAHLLAVDAVELLQHCQSFKTFAEHVQSLSSLKTVASVTTIEQLLADLIQQSLLLSQQQLLAILSAVIFRENPPLVPPCAKGGRGDFKNSNSEREQYNYSDQTETNCHITTIGIVTRNRLRSLQQAMTSYIDYSKHYGRNLKFIVMDDSHRAETRQANQQMLHLLAKQHQVTISYGGWEEKYHFAKKLIQQGQLPQDVVNFALFDAERCGHTAGANRNALLLQTLGDTFLSVDDDTLCRCVAPSQPQDDLAFAIHRDPAEITFFADRQALLQSLKNTEADILSLHEQILGQNLSTLLSTRKTHLTGFHTPFWQRLMNGSGRILVTLNGLFGDCGWGAPFGHWDAPMGCLLLEPRSHQRLTRSETDYRLGCTSREVLRLVDRITISDATSSMSTFMGLDNRELLPPYFPVQRGQDILFGLTIWQCFKHSYLAHLPLALLHAPLEQRRFWPEEIFRTAAGCDTAKLLINSIRTFHAEDKASDVEHLQALGQHLMNLGTLPLADFIEFSRRQAWHQSSLFIELMEQRLHDDNASPAFWANDVKKYLQQLQQALIKPNYWLPLDLLTGRTIEETQVLSQKLVHRFGQLLYWWPTVVTTTKTLRSQGESLTKELSI